MEFLKSLPSELYVFIISMLPFIELRGAVPVGAALGIPFYVNFLISLIGNMLPVPFILLFIPKILDFLSRFRLFRPITDWLRRTADKHSKKVLMGEPSGESAEANNSLEPENEAEKATERHTSLMTPAIFTALMLFVALPIPGTGAWSGALVASLFSLSRKYSFLAILLGVIICGVVMTLASYGVVGFLSFLA